MKGQTNELTQQVSLVILSALWPPVPIYRTQRKVDTEVQGLPKCMKKKGLKEGRVEEECVSPRD